MTKLDLGTIRPTEVYAGPETIGGGVHDYEIRNAETGAVIAAIHFQEGPIKEVGLNGMMTEDLVVILINTLRGFTKGDLPSRQTSIALTKLEEALFWLNDRTNERRKRNVEGTMQK